MAECELKLAGTDTRAAILTREQLHRAACAYRKRYKEATEVVEQQRSSIVMLQNEIEEKTTEIQTLRGQLSAAREEIYGLRKRKLPDGNHSASKSAKTALLAEIRRVHPDKRGPTTVFTATQLTQILTSILAEL